MYRRLRERLANARRLTLRAQRVLEDDVDVEVDVDVGDAEDAPPAEDEVDEDPLDDAESPGDREARRQKAIDALRSRYGGEGVEVDGDGRLALSQPAEGGIERPPPKLPRPTVYKRGPKLRSWNL